MAPSDPELLGRVASGDGAAFAELYDRHAPRLLTLLIGWVGRREDAEDVLQEAFCQVWSQAARYDAMRSPVQAWLVLITRSRALDHLRRRRPETAAAPGDKAAPASDPLGALEQDESAQRVRDALALLPDEQRSALTLAFFGGLTNEQVARQQAIPLGTAKTRIRLGMKRLRDLLCD
jgi:RNA polymerase sigma-70 factor (ECF subfamily)